MGFIHFKKPHINWFRTIFVMLTITLSVQAKSAFLCRNLFKDKNLYHPVLGYDRGKAEKMMLAKYSSSASETRNATFTNINNNSQLSGVIYSRIFPLNPIKKNNSTIDARTEFYQFVPSLQINKSSTSDDQLYKYQDFVTENINFVLTQYQNRREWTDEFRNHLLKDAYNYALQSIYFNVRMYRKLLGSLKLVLALDHTNQNMNSTQEKLPMEEYLNINLESNHGLKIEPSNFAILKEYNNEVFPELMLQLVSYAQTLAENKDLDIDRPLFYTYGDDYSVRLYQGMGFHYLKKQTDSQGIVWNILQASLRDIIDLPNLLKKSRKNWPEDLRIEFLHFLEIFKENRFITANQIWSSRAINHNLEYVDETKKGFEMSLIISEEHSYKGESVKRLELYSRNRDDIEVGWLMLSHNNKLLPLDNEKKGNQILNYKDQDIVLERNYQYFKIKIKVKLNKDHTQPEKVEFEKTFNKEYLVNYSDPDLYIKESNLQLEVSFNH